jgi:hypothetical protein
LYELVWARPVTQVAPEFRVSDVSVAKACRRANVPIPARGYWARKRAGLTVEQAPLPDPQRGKDRTGLHWPGDDDLDEMFDFAPEPTPPAAVTVEAALPPRPTFADDIKERLKMLREQVGEVVVHQTSARTHGVGRRLLDEDRWRRDSDARFLGPWNGPKFTSPLARRRLKLLNTVCLALERAAAPTKILDDAASHLRTTVNGEAVFFNLEGQQAFGSLSPGEVAKMLAFKLKDRSGKGESKKIWNERREPLEGQLADVVVHVLLAAEKNRRDAAITAHVALERAREARIWEAQRARERLERQRVEKLERDAADYRRSSDIRALVAAAAACGPPTAELERWSRWALAQAERIDPVANGTVLDAPDASSLRFSSW